MVLVRHPLADPGCLRPAVCSCWSVPLQAQCLRPDAGLLLAVQRSTHLLLILPQHTVQCVQSGWDSHTVHLRTVDDPRVGVADCMALSKALD